MAHYTCPVCHAAVARDLVAFLDHAHEHIIDEIKKEHPDWVRGDGVCPQCLEYYEKAKRGEAGETPKPKKGKRPFERRAGGVK